MIPAGNSEWFARFFHAAIDRGVYLPPSSYEVGFVSMAHDERTLETAAAALIESAQVVDAVMRMNRITWQYTAATVVAGLYRRARARGG